MEIPTLSQFEYVELKKLKPDKKNARRHSDRNIEEVKRSLLEFGQHAPLVVRKADNSIIVGNARFQAMKELGWDKALVLYVDDDEATAVKRSLADNRTGELAEWNDDILKELLESLGPDNLDIPGWNEDELEAMLGIADFGGPGARTITFKTYSKRVRIWTRLSTWSTKGDHHAALRMLEL